MFRELICDPAGIGAVCSSSKQLASRISAWVDVSQEGWVIELGGGTGVVTEALLKRGVDEKKLIVVEKSYRLVQHLRERFPNVQIFHGDAAEIEMIDRKGIPVAAFVSGLPLRSIAKAAVTKITQSCMRILGGNGRLVQFTYAPVGLSPWLSVGLSHEASEIVWLNLPPARIEIFKPTSVPGQF